MVEQTYLANGKKIAYNEVTVVFQLKENLKCDSLLMQTFHWLSINIQLVCFPQHITYVTFLISGRESFAVCLTDYSAKVHKLQSMKLM